nr:hypothetical protein [Deinococcus peraridilitoris]
MGVRPAQDIPRLFLEIFLPAAEIVFLPESLDFFLLTRELAALPREGLHALPLGGFDPLAQYSVADPEVSGRARDVTRVLGPVDGIPFEFGAVRFAARHGGAPYLRADCHLHKSGSTSSALLHHAN